MCLLTLSSCSKWNDDRRYDSDNVLGGAAGLSVIHASPNMTALDVALNDNRFDVNYFNYTDRIEYLRAYPGNRRFSLFREGSYDTLYASNINLTGNKYYSIFVLNAPNNTETVLLRDSTRAAQGDSMRIRFVNMSPDVAAIDLYQQGNATPVITNVNFKTASNFISLKAGDDMVFDIKPAGQAVTIASTDELNLRKGYVYTIWSTGFRSMTTDPGKLRVEAYLHH